MKKKHFLLLLVSGTFLGASSFKGGEKDVQEETKVVISTDLGNIKLKLYNETPLHRDNFIKLVNTHFYDSVLFHRVIQGFMIQGGDPESKNAAAGVMLGEGNVGYNIPAEFHANLFHKRGVLAAARESDEVNPNKESSGCQFYIVQGKVFGDADLNMLEQRINTVRKQKLFEAYINRKENEKLKEKFAAFQMANQIDSLNHLSAQVEPYIQQELQTAGELKFSEEQRKAYTTIGGAPHLDGSYTVFGEVIEGLDVVDKIAAGEVDSYSRPFKDVRMKITVVK